VCLGWRTIAATIASSGCLAWAYALWPFGVWAGVVGGVCGTIAGVLGAGPLARLEEQAAAEGGLMRWASMAGVLVALWLALVIVPSIVGAVAWSRHRSAANPNPSLRLTAGRITVVQSSTFSPAAAVDELCAFGNGDRLRRRNQIQGSADRCSRRAGTISSTGRDKGRTGSTGQHRRQLVLCGAAVRSGTASIRTPTGDRSMAKTKPQGATKCGSHCYLFKSSTNSSDCLISAHGGFVAENRSFKIPSGVTILFYGVHGAALLDPNITTFAKEYSKAEPVETYSGGQNCRNYLLSKYQGAHAGASGTDVVETYDQVGQTVTNRDKIRNLKFAKMTKEGQTQDIQQKVFNELMMEWGGSILTIRNRWDVFFGVPLSEAINSARKEMPSLRTFHCIFCRCTMMPDSVAKKLGHTQHADVGVKYNW
jgi:hypothetical protein